jgi:peptidoglycan-associated lipoprotein
MARLNVSATLAGLTVALLLSACATKEPPPAPAAATPPPAPQAQAPQAAPAPAPVVSSIVPGSRQDFEQNVGDRVHFDYDRSDLDQQDRDTLQKQAQWLARYPQVTLVVEGHADERGTREYNLALAARRANSVKEYLTSLGVSAARLETISYGKERPMCIESTEACWEQNRRGVSAIRSGAVASAS